MSASEVEEFVMLINGFRPSKRSYLMGLLKGLEPDEAAAEAGVSPSTVTSNWLYRDPDSYNFQRCVTILSNPSVRFELKRELIRHRVVDRILDELDNGYKSSRGVIAPRTEVLRMGGEMSNLLGQVQENKPAINIQIVGAQMASLTAAIQRQMSKLEGPQADLELTEEQVKELREAQT